jgi:hypothetical protein
MTEYDWHTDLEKELIVEFGGEPTESYARMA